MTRVLDSSAVLAFIWAEPGNGIVAGLLEGSMIGAVNYAEVCTKLVDFGMSAEDAAVAVNELNIDVISFDADQALAAARLRSSTKHAGLSLGDRACLALALARNAEAVTADRAWTGLVVGVGIRQIR